MKLTEINDRVDELRERRDALHEELHAVQADDDISQGEARAQEQRIRGEIREINEECYPLEVVRGKFAKLGKGVKLLPDEAELFADCRAQVEERHGGIEIG